MLTKKPNDKEECYALLADGNIAKHFWGNNAIENNMLLQGNMFKTEKEAKAERERRLLNAMREAKGLQKPFLQIKADGKVDFLIVDDRYAISFEDIVNLCEEYKKCQKA